eukprot:GHVU01082558.1.p1 GENE.GHVU01082558.1~~GHVU01082558.1.p1  ORF type:complete len:225 (-),score=33.14 GHVU01082558.1:466-1140(-)
MRVCLCACKPMCMCAYECVCLCECVRRTLCVRSGCPGRGLSAVTDDWTSANYAPRCPRPVATALVNGKPHRPPEPLGGDGSGLLSNGLGGHEVHARRQEEEGADEAQQQWGYEEEDGGAAALVGDEEGNAGDEPSDGHDFQAGPRAVESPEISSASSYSGRSPAGSSCSSSDSGRDDDSSDESVAGSEAALTPSAEASPDHQSAAWEAGAHTFASSGGHCNICL